MQRHRTFHVIGRRTGTQKAVTPGSVRSAARRTSACRLCPCTFSHTIWTTSVMCVENASVDLGYFKVTEEVTQEKNRTPARTAGSRSQTGQTFARTCKRTLHKRRTSVRDATNSSLSSRILASTTSQPASRTSRQMSMQALDLVLICFTDHVNCKRR